MNYLEESTHACTLCDNDEPHMTCQTILAPTSVSAKSLTKFLHALRAGTLYCLMWNKRHDGSHPFLFEPRRRPPFRTAKRAAWEPHRHVQTRTTQPPATTPKFNLYTPLSHPESSRQVSKCSFRCPATTLRTQDRDCLVRRVPRTVW
jgi:hypothetical protein